MFVLPDAKTVVLFIATAVAILIVPGPAVLYVIARSLERGWRTGIVSALGLSGGAIVHILLATLGVTALIQASPLAFAAIRLAGASYLVFLGWRTIAQRHSGGAGGGARGQSLWKVYGQAMAVNLSNPKAMLFFFAFLPQFVDATKGNVPGQLLGLGAVFLVVAFLNDSTWAIVAGSVGTWIRRKPSLAVAQRYLAGLVLIVLGVAAAISIL